MDREQERTVHARQRRLRDRPAESLWSVRNRPLMPHERDRAIRECAALGLDPDAPLNGAEFDAACERARNRGE